MLIKRRLATLRKRTLLDDFEYVYEEEMPKMLRALQRQRVGLEDAEDIVANATMRMLRLIKRGEVEPGEESARKLFWTVLRGKRVDFQRQQVSEQELRAALAELALNEEAKEGEERLSDRLAAVGLPDEDIELIRLRYEEDLDYEHIAKAMKLKPATARKRMSRLLARLSQMVGKDVLEAISTRLVEDMATAPTQAETNAKMVNC